MLFMSLLSVITSFCFLARLVDGQTAIPQDLNGQLAHRLSHEPLHQPEVFSRAVHILESIESAPSCHRLATFGLIDSCQSLEPSSASEVSLTSIRERYATRLAMCELTSAKIQAPVQCEAFVPGISACQQETFGQKLKRTFRAQSGTSTDLDMVCFPHASDQVTKQCLHALHSKPQWWTSYSNALQNVLIVCQAGRNAVEKDEILRVFRKGTQASSDMSAALAMSLKRATEFNIAVERLKSQMLQDWHTQAEKSKASFALIIVDIHKAVHAALTSLNDGIDATVGKLTGLNLDLIKGHLEVSKTQAALELLQRNVTEQNIAMVSKHHSDMNSMSLQASIIEERLKRIILEDFASIREASSDHLHKLRNFTDMVSASNDNFEHHLAVSTENLERQADAIAKVASPSESKFVLAIFSFLLGTVVNGLGSSCPKLAMVSMLIFALFNLSGPLLLGMEGFFRYVWRFRSLY